MKKKYSICHCRKNKIESGFNALKMILPNLEGVCLNLFKLGIIKGLPHIHVVMTDSRAALLK